MGTDPRTKPSDIKQDDTVEILINGEWTGPYTVIRTTGGRTTDHIFLEGKHGAFEHYNDAPYNTRKVFF